MRNRKRNMHLGLMKVFYAISWRLGLNVVFHAIQLPNSNLKYVPIPKNASSSMLSVLVEQLYPDQKENIEPHSFFWDDFRNYHFCWNNKFCAVVRHPTSRFISGFQNRVIDKNVDDIYHLFPSSVPCIYFFADNISLFRRHSKDIRHHFRPQSIQIPPKAVIYRLEEIDPVFHFFGKQETKRNVSKTHVTSGYDIDRIGESIRSFYLKDFMFYEKNHKNC